jgi:ferredoxin-NADP reductase/DMSO/TMAO reductase YedYZ heme-binding membrane subunit
VPGPAPLPSAAVAPGEPVAAPPAPRGRRRRLTAWDLGVLVGANTVAVVGLWWRQGGLSEIHDAAGLLTSLGRVTGMLGALLALIQLLLLARIPVLDDIALDRVNGWHRWNGIACVGLLVAHTVLIVVGYALADGVGLGAEIADLLSDYSGVLIATIGLVLLVAVAVTSAAAARRRLGRRAWHAIHVSAYLSVALAFSHQLATGHEFQRQPVARAYWWALYGATALAIVTARIVLPAVRSLVVHRLRVERVVADAPGVVSIEIGGRALDRLGARAGQYLHWRFLAPGHWTRAMALSLSAAPDGRRLRVTMRERPGGGASLAALRPGTRVIAEGPAGGLTSAARRRARVALIAGGPGIAPVRALLEDMPAGAGEIAVVCVGARAEAPLGDDLDALARRRGADVHWVAADDTLGAERLRALVPDIAERDVFVAGPTGMVRSARAGLRGAGVAARQISSEGFG